MMLPPLVKKTLDSVVTDETAPSLAALEASVEMQRRVDELATKSTAGTLSGSEEDEYDELLHWSFLLSELKVRARAHLQASA